MQRINILSENKSVGLTIPVSIKIRDFAPLDYPRLAEIYDEIFPERTRSIEEWRFYDESLDKSKYYFKRYASIDPETDETMGFAEMSNTPWMFHPKKFWLDGWVHPEHQGHGVGSALYGHLLVEMAKLGATTVWMGIRENMNNSVAFANTRGFYEKMRGWESTIDPSRVDTSQFGKYSVQAAQTGITFSTLEQELRDDPNCYLKLHQLVQTTFRDVPLADKPTDTSYDQWLAFEMKNPNLIPEGYIIAKDQDRYVGTSVVWRLQKEPRSLSQGLTGVLREYRGKGIAIALKLQVFDFARRNGFDHIRTFNASTNEGMLAINQRLGFKRDPAWITFEKRLS